MAHHLFLPLIVPLLSAGVATIVSRRRIWARVIAVAATLFNLGYGAWLLVTVAVMGRQVTQAGGWVAPFGITLMADGLSAIMLLLTALLTLVTIMFSFATIDARQERFYYYPLLLLLMFGCSGAFLTGDLFNLYVWFEILLVASFGLITLGGSRAQLEGGLKYVVLNLFASLCFLVGAGLIYGVAGTLNMAHLAERLNAIQEPTLVTAVAGFFLIAFGSKAALAPVFFWLPTSYHTPSIAVTALFGGLLSKVGIYALYRVFGTVFQSELARLAPLILAVAGVTMVVGVIGAMAQVNVRRILAFHIVSQVGYMAMGLGLASVAGLTAGILFMAHNIVVKTALFLIGGAAEHLTGTGELKQMGGMARREPFLAVLWLLASFALVGIPPLSGFFGKLGLIQAGVAQEQWLIVGVAAGVSLFTLFSMLKIWNEVFWKKAYSDLSHLPRAGAGLLAPAVILVAVSIALGLGAAPALEYSVLAAEQALDTAGLARDVCGPDSCDTVELAVAR
ncbi:MAG: proton-conducting transporter membrane subunit [Chloroflexaceae bacterium]|nr:proton-conducting transporter membrane subunit [Chloroflexaceae bacterium]